MWGGLVVFVGDKLSDQLRNAAFCWSCVQPFE